MASLSPYSISWSPFLAFSLFLHCSAKGKEKPRFWFPYLMPCWATKAQGQFTRPWPKVCQITHPWILTMPDILFFHVSFKNQLLWKPKIIIELQLLQLVLSLLLSLFMASVAQIVVSCSKTVNLRVLSRSPKTQRYIAMLAEGNLFLHQLLGIFLFAPACVACAPPVPEMESMSKMSDIA